MSMHPLDAVIACAFFILVGWIFHCLTRAMPEAEAFETDDESCWKPVPDDEP
jgi:hypothetical protein